MELSVDMRKDFSEKVRAGVRSLIDLNQIEDLDEFDAGLYISNVFDRTLKEVFDLKTMDEAELKSIRAFLWSSVYNSLETEKYEKYIASTLNI